MVSTTAPLVTTGALALLPVPAMAGVLRLVLVTTGAPALAAPVMAGVFLPTLALEITGALPLPRLLGDP